MFPFFFLTQQVKQPSVHDKQEYFFTQWFHTMYSVALQCFEFRLKQWIIQHNSASNQVKICLFVMRCLSCFFCSNQFLIFSCPCQQTICECDVTGKYSTLGDVMKLSYCCHPSPIYYIILLKFTPQSFDYWFYYINEWHVF